MNEKIEVPTMKVPPLKKICMTIGQLPASYVESMSYYEMLVWFVHYLRDDIIPVVNANSEATKELQELYVELQSYVNNYFDNLDVQEEINNKLDEMADSGQLTDIIGQYLGLAGMITFNNVAEMKEAQNLVNGSKCATLGYHNVNDGGNAFYKIRTITNDDVVDDKKIIELYDNNLIAELIYEEPINIKTIGAKGDGETNDTDIFKYAIANFKSIYVPLGKYIITDTLFIEPNQKIYGEKNNSFFNGQNYGSTIIFNGNDEDPAISFLGTNTSTGLKEKGTYTILGSTLDNGTYTQTISSELKYINIYTSTTKNVGIVFSGCPNSQLEVSCYGFIFGIITSSCWGSSVKNCFVYGKYGIYIGSDNNNVKYSSLYLYCSDKSYSVASDNKLYAVVNSTNVEEHSRNQTSGIITIFVNYSSLNDVICENFKIGFNFGGSTYISCYNIYGEANDVFMSVYTGSCSVDGAYMYNTTGTQAISYNINYLTLNNVYSTYPLLLKEYNNWLERYGRYYILNNVRDLNNNISYFDSTNPDELYIDSTSVTNGIGIKNDPINSITTAINKIKDGGKLILKTDYALPTTGANYIEINKNLTITSDGDTKKTISNTSATLINPIRYFKDLHLDNLNINIATTQNPSDVSNSCLLNPRNSALKKLTISNCTINISEYNGLINADYNKNTYTDLIISDTSITGSCVITKNHYAGGSSKKLYMKTYYSNNTYATDVTYGTQTELVESYED